MLASPLCLTTKNELSSLVCFSRPVEEDDALFGVVASEATRTNEVEVLEQEAALREKKDHLM